MSVYYKHGEYGIADFPDEDALRKWLINEIGDYPNVPCYETLLRGVSRIEVEIESEDEFDESEDEIDESDKEGDLHVSSNAKKMAFPEELDKEDRLKVSKNAEKMLLLDLVNLVIEGGKYIMDTECGYGLVSVIDGTSVAQRQYRDAPISFSQTAKS